MEKFDIVIHPNIAERGVTDENSCYYVPCMIKEEPGHDIYEMFNVTQQTCRMSTWLGFKFRFLPPHLINHLISSLCRSYVVAEVVNSKQRERKLAIFRGKAVVELQKTTKLRKLLLTTCPNLIQLQILEFGENVTMQRGMYKYIADFVAEEINKIISTRYRMTNVYYEKRWECGLTKPEFVTGSNAFSEEQITEYYCGTCARTHKHIGEWSGVQGKTLIVSEAYIYEFPAQLMATL
ncbi:unnamed protein product [Mytilus coruscus]|uniref:Uncharacterized protein n=1 Tax=Mytilus coruscus TaxID=42192 RepID=A0A6J8ALX3_MYTCO|nr:unnamed protein product [Mytilus coruscus]